MGWGVMGGGIRLILFGVFIEKIVSGLMNEVTDAIVV
jgi:hypothetical protein